MNENKFIKVRQNQSNSKHITNVYVEQQLKSTPILKLKNVNVHNKKSILSKKDKSFFEVKMKRKTIEADKMKVMMQQTDSCVHSSSRELCLSQEWPLSQLTQTSKLKRFNSQQSVPPFEPVSINHSTIPAAGQLCSQLEQGYSLNISEYISVVKDTCSLGSMPTKLIKYLHKKRLAERGYRMTNKKLGEGGFGAVYKVYPIENAQRPLACKIMLLSKEQKVKKDRSSILQAYSNEIYVMKSSQHTNIVSLVAQFVYGRGQSPEELAMSHSYIVMEYANLGTLYSKLKKHGPFEESKTCCYFGQISAALLDLHKRGIAHRDLKLGNILLTSTEDGPDLVKLTDFGLSRVVHSVESGIISFSKPAGTLSYMSPQIIACYVEYNTGNKAAIVPYDPFKADTWALGVCLFLMLSKVHPFENPPSNKAERIEFAKRMLEKQIKKEWQIPNSLSNKNPSELCHMLLNRLLEPNINKRYNIYKVMRHSWLNPICNC